VVLNSHPLSYNRIEIREVEFTGTPTTPVVPQPTGTPTPVVPEPCGTPTAAAVPEPTSILGMAIAGFGMVFAKHGSKRQSK
jgi:hypothetical protein